MNYIRKAINDLEEYYVPQDLKIKLNQNESPYDIPKELKEDILSSLNKVSWNRYPPMIANHLTEAISEYVNYPTDGIVVANASNEIIKSVFQAICNPGDNITVVSPTFAIYPRLAKIMDLKLIEVPLLKDFKFDVPSIIEKSKQSKMVVLALPNNPTGTTISAVEIEEIASSIEGIFVIDEAYFEYSGETAIELLDKYENLIITRTFSKIFALAGLRLGYLLARKEIAQAIQKAKLPFSVGIFQQIAGEVVMRRTGYIKERVAEILLEKKKMFSEMQKINLIKPIPSHTNFILMEISGMTGNLLFKEMYKRGILLREFNINRLKNTLRVTVGKPFENKIFIETLKEVINSRNKIEVFAEN